MTKLITRLLKYGTIASTYLLVASVLLQIFARFFLPNTPAWTEEASRLFFVYAISFAAGLALRDNAYVYLEFFYDRLPSAIRRVLQVLIPISTFLLFLCMAYYTVSFVMLGHLEHSPSMKFEMSYVFASMFILAITMTFFAGKDVLNQLTQRRS